MNGGAAMEEFDAKNPDFAEAVRENFAGQGVMELFGASLVDVRPGYCEVHVPFRAGLGEREGVFYGGVVAAVSDAAGNCAAMTLAPPESAVRTVEYKFNVMEPAAGGHLVARAQVIRAGRTLAICQSDVFVRENSAETQCAASLQTVLYVDGEAAPD